MPFHLATAVLTVLFHLVEILGVRPYATVSEIKQAFFKLAKTHHPDVS